MEWAKTKAIIVKWYTYLDYKQELRTFFYDDTVENGFEAERISKPSLHARTVSSIPVKIGFLKNNNNIEIFDLAILNLFKRFEPPRISLETYQMALGEKKVTPFTKFKSFIEYTVLESGKELDFGDRAQFMKTNLIPLRSTYLNSTVVMSQNYMFVIVENYKSQFITWSLINNGKRVR